jgi:hypothetical protein
MRGGGNIASADILKHSMGARNRVGIGLSYRPARRHRLAESIPWNRFLASFTSLKGLSHEIDFKNFDKNLQNLA